MKVASVAILLLSMLLAGMALGQTTLGSTNVQVLEKLSVMSFDFPGAVNTQATAITPSGDIVGRYTGADAVQHGFLLSAGKFGSITFPRAISTDVTWINPRGEIVGSYVGSAFDGHGFLLSAGKFTPISYPNAQFTAAFGISASGEIVGIWGDSAGSLHGFLLRAGTFSLLDVTGATGSLPAMISAERIVGGYFNSTGTHGFSSTQGVVQTIDCPGSTFTFLSGLDPQGQIVGGYASADGNGHGALVIGGNCIPVDFPGGTNTYANGINPQGDIVGRYTGSDGIVHGFLWRGFVKSANVIYSAAHDFSTRLNPNAVWSYGFTTSVGGPFTLDTISGSTFFSGEVGWFGPISGATAPGFPLVVAGPNVIPTVLDMGPGPSSYAVVRWTAPSRGRWDVVGQFFGTGLTTGDVHVLRNGTPVFNSPVNGSQVAPFSLTIDAIAGDTIDFAAGPGPGGDNDFDPTGFNVTITPEGEEVSAMFFGSERSKPVRFESRFRRVDKTRCRSNCGSCFFFPPLYVELQLGLSQNGSFVSWRDHISVVLRQRSKTIRSPQTRAAPGSELTSAVALPSFRTTSSPITFKSDALEALAAVLCRSRRRLKPGKVGVVLLDAPDRAT